MSQKYWNIIEDEETDAGLGVKLDPNFDPGVDGPCNGDNCRSDECDCWDNFRSAVRQQLEKQKEAMKEVSDCCGMELYDDNEFCIGCYEKDPVTKWIEHELD